ncbi:S-layer homology domain-containing protein [Intestinimonas massiliensis (ex Afouda et al. 2020)]|uniref:S-layer homology domain-containing protein n=1 Tax=Intestinimonas massiliensis (ex Afouda et al. 2020) TaxID=1673721 RepID=UPI001031642B|nr:S-layer homology domain-containing protein [Intestinimonas massiliensis (ex Afouda et al. 2020)]
MKQRLLSGLLAVVLLLGLAPAALAAAPAEEEAAQVLAALDIMVGDQNGDLALDRTITRAEFTKLAVAASSSRDTVGDTVAVKPYPDVPQTHWAAPYIKAAVDLGLVQGDLRGYFNPDRTITLAEGVTLVLRLLGYEDSEFTGVWPSGQMAQYRALDLDEGISLGQNGSMTRRDAMYLFYNLLLTKNKSGVYYLNVLEPTLNLVNAAGELDRVALINSAMEGPVVAASGWQSKLPFSASTAKVYRNGKASSLDAVQVQDVVYWSESMRTVWAYDDKVTGTYEAAAPSVTAPTSVTVAGKTYAIETTDAAYDLSDLGQYQIGDTVTLLLGRSGGVAAVADSQIAGAVVYGVITKVENAAYDDGNGGTYTARTVTVSATNSGSYRYQTTNKNLEVGDLVRVDTSGDGTVTRLSETRLTGKMNSDGTKLGSYTLADDVQIIDTYEERTPIRVYPQRLAGVNFTGDMVRYYVRNAQGEITHLILNDVTGDLHKYGVITDVNEVDVSIPGGGFMVSSSYTYDVGGQELVFGSSSSVYNLSEGPCQVKMDSDTNIERLVNLNQIRLSAVSGTTAVGTDNREYTLSETVAVYVVVNGEYQLSSLSRIQGGSYTLTGWYDKDETSGGRIRVVVAR